MVYDYDLKSIIRQREEYQASLKKNENERVLEDNFEEGVDFNYEQSSSSIKLQDIKGIIYGGLSSRFWMFRKHMICNSVKKTLIGNAPFYAWQCITLQLTHREVDLVIREEKDMDDLLELIIESMNTVDGNKNSA